MKKFTFSESYSLIRKNSFKKRIFRWLTKSSSNLFLRSKDAISLNLFTVGTHEPALTRLINFYAESGYSDFLIDIGANIGVTSCQNGQAFKSIFMFEPNPYCFKILEVNTAMNLDATKCHLFNYGLGLRNQKAELSVPRYNWGGGFVKDDLNSYSESLLAEKDGFARIDQSNYLAVQIDIKKGSTVFKRIFEKLQATNQFNGVIKIDTEGYEPIILEELAKSLPKDFRVKIIFESFNPDLDINAMIGRFNREVKVRCLVRKLPWKEGASGLTRSLCFKPIVTELVEINRPVGASDMVLELD